MKYLILFVMICSLTSITHADEAHDLEVATWKQSNIVRLKALRTWRKSAVKILNQANPDAWFRDNMKWGNKVMIDARIRDIENDNASVEAEHRTGLVRKQNRRSASQVLKNYDCSKLTNLFIKNLCILNKGN